MPFQDTHSDIFDVAYAGCPEFKDIKGRIMNIGYKIPGKGETFVWDIIYAHILC